MRWAGPRQRMRRPRSCQRNTHRAPVRKATVTHCGGTATGPIAALLRPFRPHAAGRYHPRAWRRRTCQHGWVGYSHSLLMLRTGTGRRNVRPNHGRPGVARRRKGGSSDGQGLRCRRSGPSPSDHPFPRAIRTGAAGQGAGNAACRKGAFEERGGGCLGRSLLRRDRSQGWRPRRCPGLGRQGLSHPLAGGRGDGHRRTGHRRMGARPSEGRRQHR